MISLGPVKNKGHYKVSASLPRVNGYNLRSARMRCASFWLGSGVSCDSYTNLKCSPPIAHGRGSRARAEWQHRFVGIFVKPCLHIFPAY